MSHSATGIPSGARRRCCDRTRCPVWPVRLPDDREEPKKLSDPSQNKPDADERQRAAQALELRTSGMTYAAVAAALGYSDESGARKAVDRLLSRVECEGAEELRRLEGQRLDAMQRAIWPQCGPGDLDASKAGLSIQG